METIEKIVNSWYQTFSQYHEDAQFEFEDKLIDLLPEYQFTYAGDRWIIINQI